MVSALGLDLGRKRIGVAGCDGTGLIATGLTTIWRKSLSEDLAQLEHICHERQVDVLVIGLPYSMDGSLGAQARQAQKLAQRIAVALNLPIEYVDERLTSLEAEDLMRRENQDPRHHRDLVDRKAAALILQRWLDQQRSGSSNPL
jgi:putative holliday junction resolvase